MKGFAHTAAYDSAISAYLGQVTGESAPVHVVGHRIQSLRYGENPHQTAALYSLTPGAGPLV